MSAHTHSAPNAVREETRDAPAEDVVELGRELDVVLLEVLVQLVRAEDLGDLDQLVLCRPAAESVLKYG